MPKKTTPRKKNSTNTKNKGVGKKPFNFGKAYNADSLIEYSPESIVSRTLIDNASGTITLFAFDKGQGLSEHYAPFDAFVQIVDGTGRFFIGGVPVDATAGDVLVLPEKVAHSVKALKKFKMLLVMIRGKKG